MHSSRMCTVRSSSHPDGVSLPDTPPSGVLAFLLWPSAPPPRSRSPGDLLQGMLG